MTESDEGSRPRSTTPRAVGARFQARDQQKIDNFNRAIGESDTDGSTGWRLAHEFRMIDGKRATIGQMDIEGPKRTRTQEFLQCLNRHVSMLARHTIRVNDCDKLIKL